MKSFRSFFPATLIIFCLAFVGAVSASAQNKQNESSLSNAEVIKLAKAGFKEKTIILIIAARLPNFDLSPDRMIQLKRAGVSENIIVAMLARQEGRYVPTDDTWGDDPFFGTKLDPKGEPKSSDGTSIFGSSGGSKQSSRSRGVDGSASGESEVTGSATVRILRPPAEPGDTGPARLEKTKSLTNNSIIELVEAGFSEGTIIRRIEQSPVEFDLAENKLEELRRHRVSEKVLAAMKAAMGEDK
jgi:hypothetical protein